jgi:ribonucleoside-diphosphate reductase alpha chain
MMDVAYATSLEMVPGLGAFDSYASNAAAVPRVVHNHARAANGKTSGYEALCRSRSTTPH